MALSCESVKKAMTERHSSFPERWMKVNNVAHLRARDAHRRCFHKSLIGLNIHITLRGEGQRTKRVLLSTAIFLGLTVEILFCTIGTVGCTSGWSITVETDRPCYGIGDTVCIGGRLTYNDWPQESGSVSICVISLSTGTTYYLDSATTDSDGSYNSSFTLGVNAEMGEYIVNVTAGVADTRCTNQTTFQVADPICIEESGEVDPANAPISRNGNIYTLTNNIFVNSTDGIIIERNDIILDGMSFTLNGTGLVNSTGIYLSSVSNVTIENMSIRSFAYGIYEQGCSNCDIIETNFFFNLYGINFQNSWYNTVEANNITMNSIAGIFLEMSQYNNISMNSLTFNGLGAINLQYFASYNSIVGNNFVNTSKYGVYVSFSCYNNQVFHNNFINNTVQAYVDPTSSGNVWDDGYPSGGNYWSDYKGTDLFNGPYQNVTGSDAIGDTPYVIDNSNIDHYPLMQPWTSILALSSTSIIFSVNPAAIGSPVTCTATVSGSNPTGIVTWITSSNTGYFSNSKSMLSSGNCSTTYIDTSPGTVTITTNYSGDLNNAQDNSSAALTVSPVTTFDQVGVGSDFNGTVVTIDGINYTASELPVSFLWVEGSSHSFSYASPLGAAIGEQYVWNSTSGLSGVQNGSLNVTGSGILTGNYYTQYYLTLATNTSGVNHLSGQGWYDASSYASISAAQYVDIVSGSSRYAFSGWTTGNMTEIADSSLPATTVLIDEAKTVTANYVTQYRVTFADSGVGSDFLGSVMDVSGTDYDWSGYSDWFDSGASVAFNFCSPLVVTPNGEQYVLVGVNASSPLTVAAATTITGSYVTQYLVTYSATGNATAVTVPPDEWVGSGGSAVGVFPLQITNDGTRSNFVGDNRTAITEPSLIVGAYQTQYYLTVDSAYDTLGGAGWYDGGSTAYATLTDGTVSGGAGTQYVFIGWSGDASGSGLTSDGITMDGPKTAAATWTTQFYLTVETSPSGVNGSAGEGWYDDGFTAHVSTHQYVDIVPGSSRYRFGSWTGASGIFSDATIIMDSAKTATANYVTQYYLTFAQSAVGSDFAGSVINVGGTDYDRSGYSNWFDSGASISFGFYSPLVVTLNGEQYVLTGVSGNSTASSLTVSAATTVTGTYKTQYSITFDQSGVGPDCNGTVVVIDGSNYNVSALSASFWWDKGSTYIFAFQSPLGGTSGTDQYNWTSTTGLSSLQSGLITVNGPGTVVGNYVILVHDVAVMSVVAGPSVVCQGYGCAIEASLANIGDFPETINVTIYANNTDNGNVTAIYTFANVPLNSQDSTMLTFIWDTTGFVTGNYTISAYATLVPGESDLANNAFVSSPIQVIAGISGGGGGKMPYMD
jgi:parallel beta-helix repeat protein